MFRRILSSLGIGSEPPDADTFTRHALGIFREHAREFQIEIVAPLEFKVTAPGGSSQQVYLDNLYKACLAHPKKQDAEIARFAKIMLDGGGAAEVILPKNVVPVVRDRPWVDEMEQFLSKNADPGKPKVQLAFEPLGADLVILYVCDNPQTIQYLTREDVEALHLSGQTLRSLAIDNLGATITEIKSEGARGFHFFSAGGSYEPSLLLLDKIWTQFQKHIQGEIIFGIPARDALYVADSAVPEAVAHLAKITPELFRDAPYRVSDRLYVRHSDRITFYNPTRQSLAT